MPAPVEPLSNLPDVRSSHMRRRWKQHFIVVCALVMCIVGLWWTSRDRVGDVGLTAGQSPHGVELQPVQEANRVQAVVVQPTSEDDGESMWISPTAGQPLSWEYLPPGVQILLAIRPRELMAHVKGEKFVAALGTLADEGIRTIESVCGVPFREIERVLIGWQITKGRFAPTVIAFGPMLETSDPPKDGWSYLRTEQDNSPNLIAGSESAIAEIKSLAGQSPPLRREMETLIANTDLSRHVTLIILPGVLSGEGRPLHSGPWARLRDALDWLLGDETKAAVFSLHWGEDFFVEYVASLSSETSTPRGAQILAGRIASAATLVEDVVGGLNTTSHARQVIARLPEMVRKLASFARVGFERDCVLARSYLPATAGHNLALAAELVLMESAGANESDSPEAAAVPERDSVADRLNRRLTFKLPRDTFDAALAQLARELNAEITIIGADLQADGITKNQSLELNLEDRTGEEILVEILRRANPDKSSTGPADPRQKLVYVVRRGAQGDEETIYITTRLAAATRGETLPAVFE